MNQRYLRSIRSVNRPAGSPVSGHAVVREGVDHASVKGDAARVKRQPARPAGSLVGPMRSEARNVITADRGDKPAAEEGDAAVALEFDGWAVVR
jgi:hypothetical protein